MSATPRGGPPRPAGLAAGRVELPGTRRCVYLRELCGADEESVSGRDTLAALRLLDRLLTEGPGASIRPGSAALLTATERHLLLAHVYRTAFGARIDGTVRCTGCGEPFDLDFSLDEMETNVLRRQGSVSATADSVYPLADGRSFRLPIGEDELAVLGLDPAAAAAQLLSRCMVQGNASPEEADVVEAMEKAGPLLDLDLQANCPACGLSQAIRFSIQDYLLAALERDADRLVHEVHQLAATYSWGLGEILSLRRRRRQSLAELISWEPQRSHR